MYLHKRKENNYFLYCDSICKYISKNYLKKIPSQFSLKLPSDFFKTKINNKIKISPIKLKLWNFTLYYFLFSKKPCINNNKIEILLKINSKNLLNLNILNLINSLNLSLIK
jgi:hypothetical protein